MADEDVALGAQHVPSPTRSEYEVSVESMSAPTEHERFTSSTASIVAAANTPPDSNMVEQQEPSAPHVWEQPMSVRWDDDSGSAVIVSPIRLRRRDTRPASA